MDITEEQYSERAVRSAWTSTANYFAQRLFVKHAVQAPQPHPRGGPRRRTRTTTAAVESSLCGPEDHFAAHFIGARGEHHFAAPRRLLERSPLGGPEDHFANPRITSRPRGSLRGTSIAIARVRHFDRGSHLRTPRTRRTRQRRLTVRALPPRTSAESSAAKDSVRGHPKDARLRIRSQRI
ncbi:hypothetical protein PVAP13_9KG280313 [Panicum virgatum]|uniref:Uncharacterized protein n=1 Tax=Panicum virgatum TaxID=38727 RepID=A0A8T0NL29_PANVG|nr:hypothetical protein PVAP13_9KG280313 [Panicum virgatum]